MSYAKIVDKINEWNAQCRCNRSRNELLEMAEENNFKSHQVGEFIAWAIQGNVAIAKIKDGYDPSDIHSLAREMVIDGYNGEGLDDERQAKMYIAMAATNPNVEQELPEKGRLFWRACAFEYRGWKAVKAAEAMRRDYLSGR